MAVSKRFSVLSLIGTLFKVAAWIVLLLALLGALATVLAGPLLRQSAVQAGIQSDLILLTGAGGIVIGLTAMATGVITFLGLFALGESIHLQLAIEENTRLTAALLLRLDEENSRDAVLESGEATYYGEVIR